MFKEAGLMQKKRDNDVYPSLNNIVMREMIRK